MTLGFELGLQQITKNYGLTVLGSCNGFIKRLTDKPISIKQITNFNN